MAGKELIERGRRRRSDIVEFVATYVAECGYSPTMLEIGRGVGISSPNAVRNHLLKLRDEGLITMQARTARSVQPVGGPCSGGQQAAREPQACGWCDELTDVERHQSTAWAAGLFEESGVVAVEDRGSARPTILLRLRHADFDVVRRFRAIVGFGSTKAISQHGYGEIHQWTSEDVDAARGLFLRLNPWLSESKRQSWAERLAIAAVDSLGMSGEAIEGLADRLAASPLCDWCTELAAIERHQTAAWAAGVFEANGSVAADVRPEAEPAVVVRLRSAKEDAIRRFQEIAREGTMRPAPRRGEPGLHLWESEGVGAAVDLYIRLLPWLSVSKREQWRQSIALASG